MTSGALHVGKARRLAADLLVGQPQRWRHTVGVAQRADELAAVIGQDDPVVLISAAWLHDIGYAEAVRDTGFHPLDGVTIAHCDVVHQVAHAYRELHRLPVTPPAGVRAPSGSGC